METRMGVAGFAMVLPIRGREQLFGGGTIILYLHAIRCRSGGDQSPPHVKFLAWGGPIPPPVPHTPTFGVTPLGQKVIVTGIPTPESKSILITCRYRLKTPLHDFSPAHVCF